MTIELRRGNPTHLSGLPGVVKEGNETEHDENTLSFWHNRADQRRGMRAFGHLK